MSSTRSQWNVEAEENEDERRKKINMNETAEIQWLYVNTKYIISITLLLFGVYSDEMEF